MDFLYEIKELYGSVITKEFRKCRRLYHYFDEKEETAMKDNCCEDELIPTEISAPTDALENDADAIAEAKQEIAPEEQPQTVEKQKKKPYFRVFLIAVGFILAAFLAWELPAVQYLRAQFLFSSGRYEAAYEAFGELGSYKDSEEMRLESRYQQALEFLNMGDIKESNWLFREIIDYKDSIALIHYISPPISYPVSP